MDIFSPVDGSVISQVADTTPEEVADAVSAARRGFDVWSARSPMERGRALRRVGEAMLQHEDELAELEARNLGAPLPSSLAMVRRAAQSFFYFGELADKVAGDVVPVEGDYFAYSKREPHGVVAAVVPWNAPIIFATKKIAPALAFGNACLLKPAPETPLSALLLERLMLESGLPEGVVRVLPGGRATGEALTGDPRVSLIVFTGHDGTGKAIAAAAAGNLVPTALELGGKSAQLVFADAPANRLVEGLASGIFANAGQACIAGSRILVERGAEEDLHRRLAERTRAIRVGDPLAPSTEVGPQTTRTQQEKTERMIRDAVAGGASLLAQAELPDSADLGDGYYVAPTLLADVRPDMEIVREEVFGPVAVLASFETEAEAIAMANDTEYGLAAGVWSTDVARAHRVADRLRAGTVWVNTYGVISDRMPFGGIGRSGYGREGGRAAVELYTRLKSVWTSLHDDEVTRDIELP
ncbi:aldehyde dehydrogenase family protein [Leucobacter sp. CSA1]|uniref:Aldehyde dehydrogenase family protein n=1 Tax=Leucobacter chromiisoli TaxID=2796471 RepID=A0A934Q308_9MICO|nr:aldehyde dehydrogenase family protein [Leucobacter chromiisoli]MBK0417479.1 aldehyde dehydrogenase family protein [Leucobacter chromiisoli]